LQLRIDEARKAVEILGVVLVGKALRAAPDGIEGITGAGDAEPRCRVGGSACALVYGELISRPGLILRLRAGDAARSIQAERVEALPFPSR